MCIVCVEYEKKKLTTKEALRNLNEMVEQVGEEHHNKIADYLEQQLVFEEQEKFWKSVCGTVDDVDEWWEKSGFGD